MLSTGEWLLPAPAGQDVSGTRQDVTAGSCSAYLLELVVPYSITVLKWKITVPMLMVI